MKILHYFIMVCILASVTACEPVAQAWTAGKNWIMGQSAPNASEITYTPPQVSSEELNLTAQTYVRPTPHTPLPVQTLFFDKDSQISTQPSAGGYYREVFGKTADGRLMVQDFFQDTQLPQTTAVILKKDANVQDFSSAILDSRSIWFNRAGQMQQVADFAQGKHTSPVAYYQDKQLIGLVLNPNEANQTVLFLDNGHILARIVQNPQKTNEWQYTLYRPNGVAILQTQYDNNTVLNAKAWHANGKPIHNKHDLSTLRQESKALEEKADAALRLMIFPDR